MVTLALVGAGRWGRNYLATAKRIAGVEIRYIIAARADSAARFSCDYQVLPDIAEIPANVHGIIIATPPHTHYGIAKKLLEKGRNLLIEKPLALFLAEAEDLEHVWKKGDAKVLVGHVQLYNPAYRTAKTLIPSLGKLTKVSFKGIVSPPRKDVSVLWDWGPHPASLFLDLIDEPITDISASGNEGHVTFVLHYANGATAEAEIRWTGNEKKRELVIESTTGKIIFDDQEKEHKVEIELKGQPVSFPSYDDASPLSVELEEFVRAIRGEGRITSDMETGVRVTELLARIEEKL